MDSERRCLQCGAELGNRRPSAVFCRGQKCKRRYYRRAASGRASNYLSGTGTGLLSEDAADNRWRHQYAQHEEAATPLTAYERELLARQKRNPGVLLPELHQLQLDRARAEQQRQDAEYAARNPLRVESPLDPRSTGSVGRRGRADRHLNRPSDPHRAILRPGPGRSGVPYWDDLPECLDGDSIGFRR